MKKLIIVLLILFTLQSCTDSQRAKIGGLGDNFTIELLNCDGKTVRKWTSTGKVHSSESSDGYYFKDAKTGKLIEISGMLIISN